MDEKNTEIASIEYRILHELIKASTIVSVLTGYLHCTCGSSFISTCQKCCNNKNLEYWGKLIKQGKKEIKNKLSPKYIDMTNCFVKRYFRGDIEVTLKEGSVYLQSEQEVAQFGVDCLKIDAPDNWDGQLSNLPDNWWDIEWEDITECPEYYKDRAE